MSREKLETIKQAKQLQLHNDLAQYKQNHRLQIAIQNSISLVQIFGWILANGPQQKYPCNKCLRSQPKPYMKYE